jgi:hypothetical protein
VDEIPSFYAPNPNKFQCVALWNPAAEARAASHKGGIRDEEKTHRNFTGLAVPVHQHIFSVTVFLKVRSGLHGSNEWIAYSGSNRNQSSPLLPIVGPLLLLYKLLFSSFFFSIPERWLFLGWAPKTPDVPSAPQPCPPAPPPPVVRSDTTKNGTDRRENPTEHLHGTLPILKAGLVKFERE